MEMVSIRLYLALSLFAAACTTSAAISPGCTSNIEILKNDSVAQQLESYLKNDMDIIEIHVKTNTCIALTNDDNTNSIKTFASASTIEKYNMFIYFIVTDMGRAIMQYPADADTLSFGVLGSQKVLINVDVMLDNNDCALNTEQFRTMSLKALSALVQIRNIRDISVCYYKVLDYSHWYYLLLSVLPYYTYNTFNTFCLTDGVTTELPQAITNKLLYWLCIVLHLTLPVGFFFIPHSVHERTDSYRKCDVPFSVSALLSYVTYWKPSSKCCCCASIKDNSEPRKRSFVQCDPDNKPDNNYCFFECQNICPRFRPEACCGCCTLGKKCDACEEEKSKSCNIKCSDINLLWNKHIERLFIFITLLFFAAGLIIHYLQNRKTNVLENELMIYSFSSAFSYTHMVDRTFPILLTIGITLVLTVFFWAVCRIREIRVPQANTTTISYPIYISLLKKGSCGCKCYNVFDLKLKTDRADLYSTVKMVSEVICNATFWFDLLIASVFVFIIFNAPIVLICCLPYVNNCISSVVEEYKTIKKWENSECKCTCRLCLIICYHFCKLLFTIVASNTMLIQTTTLVLQVIVLTLFVGIPVYPKLIAYIILLTGLIKYIMQAFLRFQSKSKHVLNEMFNSDEYKDKEEIPKTLFATVLRQCSSVNVCVLCMKIVAIVFVWFTAFVAIKHGPKDLSAWKDVIPSILLFIGPDWLSKFIYNEEADYQFINQCVERAIKEMKQTPAQQNEERRTTNLSGENATVSPDTPDEEESVH